MSVVDDLRRKIEGKAYPLDNETCSLLLDVVEAAEQFELYDERGSLQIARALETLEKHA